MSEEAAFIHAIRSQPGDDLPRLIYADWLEERGDPRSLLIRWQCQRAKLAEGSSRAREMDDDIIELLKQNYETWERPLDWWQVKTAQFRRGLLEMIYITAEDLGRWHRPLFEFAPFLYELRIKNLRDHVPVVAQIPELERITQLNLRCAGLGDGELQRLFQSPRLSSLEHLDLGFNQLHGELLRTLDRPLFAGLKSLDLSCNPLGSSGAEMLAGMQHLTRLERLNLRQTDIGGGVRALIASPVVESIKSLNLSGNDVRAEALKALARSPHLRNLEELSLGEIRLSDATVRLLGRSETLNALQVLDLRRVQLHPQVINTLGSSDLGKRLRLLRVHPHFLPGNVAESLRLLRTWFGERFSVESTFPA